MARAPPRDHKHLGRIQTNRPFSLGMVYLGLAAQTPPLLSSSANQRSTEF